MESYIHRSGRTGRAGRTGVCICFYQRKEEDQLRYVENKAVRVFLNSVRVEEDREAKKSDKFSFSSSYVKKTKQNNAFSHVCASHGMEMDGEVQKEGENQK